MNSDFNDYIDTSVGHVGGGGGFDENAAYNRGPERTPRLDEAIISSRYELPMQFKEVVKRYPLFLILLYRNCDANIKDYIKDRISLIDSLSGNSCLIWLPEPISQISKEIEQRWIERLGNLPEWFIQTINSPKRDSERISCDLADIFKIPPDKLPAFIVAEPHQESIFWDQINTEESLDTIFNDLIACAQTAREYNVKSKTKGFRREWGRRRRKTAKAVKSGLKLANEIFGEIKNIEKNLLDILLPLAPMLQSLLSCFPAEKNR
jgi:hypothetical protein